MVDEEIEIPDEFVARNKNIELAIDIMFINKETILTTIDRSITFKACVPLPSREDEDIFRGLDEILRHYNKGGYTITKIHADGEIESLLLRIKDDLDIEINVVNTDEHVGDIERLNRTIKEKFRTRYYRLTFKAIPKVMINALACVTSHAMNLFPVKGGVSTYFSPHIILGKKQLDYKKDFQHEFGEYVEASQVNNLSNTNLPQTTIAVYLRPSNSIQGGHQVMSFQTGKLIILPQVTPCNMTLSVIDSREAEAKKDSVKI